VWGGVEPIVFGEEAKEIGMGRGGEEIPVAQIRLEKVRTLRPCSSPWEKP
jgi:hypothetical protein